MGDPPACFNCETTEDVAAYRFDLDLPAIKACPVCVFALGQGDRDLLDDMKGGRRGSRQRRAGGG